MISILSTGGSAGDIGIAVYNDPASALYQDVGIQSHMPSQMRSASYCEGKAGNVSERTMSRKARTRKIRRRLNARLRTGKKIVRHMSLSGRTGTAHSKKLQSRRH